MNSSTLPGLLVVAFVGSLAPRHAMAQAPLPPALARAAADYDSAQIKSDGSELSRLLAKDYVLINGAGEVETRARFIAESAAPGFKLDPFHVENSLEMVWADGAVLAGEVRLKGVDQGKPFHAHLRFSDTWRKQHGRWQVVFTEVTRISAP